MVLTEVLWPGKKTPTWIMFSGQNRQLDTIASGSPQGVVLYWGLSPGSLVLDIQRMAVAKSTL